MSFESENAQGTDVSGIVHDGSGGPWTPAGSPYIVIGDVTVPAGETLTIEPGAQVKFDGNYSLYVHGTLTALGTETNRINITSNLPRIPPLYYWKSIQINSTGHADIKYCDISHSAWGIKLVGSSNNIVANNTISLSRTHCITLDFSSNNIIANNILSDTNGNGIDFNFSSNNTISGNNVINNAHGIQLGDSSNNNTISGNHINSNYAASIYLAKSSNNNTITHNYITGNIFGLMLMSSYNNVVTNNNISNNLNWVKWNGIVLYFSSNNTVTNNNISNNDEGIYLDTSSNNLITGNNVSSNNIHGVYLIDSNGNTITDNNISNNGEGFNLTSSSNNRIYHNNIIDNVNQAYDNMDNNFWNDTYPSGGNYWSDWSPITPDLYSGPITPQTTGSPDGICDFQYDIDADSVDYYPLKNLVDTKPPTITNLQPPDTSTTNDSTPTIGADYSDPAGINVSSVILKVDGIEVTFSATVTASGVSYVPITALPDGVHTIYLEVKDNYGNFATATWSFTVDATSPNVDAGIDATVNSTYLQDATVTDPVPSSGIASYLWTQESGPGVVIFGTPNAEDTNVGADTDGQYVCRLTVTDNAGNTAFDEFTLLWDATPPTVNAGIDATVNSTYLQDATVTDPAPSSGIASYFWTQESGPGVVIFGTINAEDTNVGADTDGQYVCRLTVTDNAGNTAFDEFTLVWDKTPPSITNLRPPDASSTNNNTPMIGADYSDSLVININSVVLIIDGIDVTSSATVTASSVIYTPVTALSDGIYTIYLEVKDNVGNLATVTWSFTVDSTPPIITDLQPPDGSITNDNTPKINANYSDSFGINVSSVLLEVDSIYITSSAVVTATGVIYIPGIPLSDSIHTVYLEVKDIFGNLATTSWSFTIDTSPPITTINPNTNIVKAGTIFTLTVTDGVTGSGVNYTQYKIDNGPWIDYSLPFSIDTFGYHNITYRSVDNLGNIETEKILSIFVPEVPVTTISIGSPQYGITPRYVNQFTQFSFSVIDYSGLGYDTYYYIDSVPLILYNEPFTVLSEGAHTIYYYTIDKLGNVEDINTFDIIVDNTPPTATITIGDPNYVLGDTWVTSSSEFTLSTADGGLLPVGIDHTQYRIWNGVWSEWSIYQNVFTLGVNDGIRYVEFYSVDLLGNMEPINNRTYVVDNTPPTTTILIEGPSYRDIPEDILNVTSETTFVFSVYNRGLQPVRFDYIEYRIWNNGTWSDWFRFSGKFNLGYENGTRYIEWYSTDKLQNKEITNNHTVFVDNIPPTTEYILQLESDNSEARISLISNDIGSGSAFTKYKIDNITWNIYSNTLAINEPGSHTVYFLSEDNLENIEEQREITLLIEIPEPTPPNDDEKDANFKPLIAFLFAIILLVVGTFVSMKKPLKKVKENKLSTGLLIVLPFVVAEAATGVISFFTGILSVPPLFGLGMIVDLTILITGLIVFMVVYRKSEQMDTK